MATTTNYSWTTPDDTDLVKNGAAAIRTLGSAIDSTVKTNADAAINKSFIDAKGDLIVGTADNTIARLAIGTDGQFLTADSASTGGMKWSLPTTITWTIRKTPTGTGTSSINSIAYNGSNLFVAAGDAGQLYTSSDGKTWTSRTSAFGGSSIYSVAYGNSLWVAVGTSGLISTSPDGITWTARTSGLNTGDIWKVIYANSLWVAVGQNTTSTAAFGITTSTDGLTWTARSVTGTIGTLGLDVAYGGGYWVAGGTSSTNNIAYSTNGTSWTAAAGGTASAAAQAIIYSNSTWFLFHSGTAKFFYNASTPNTSWTSTNEQGSQYQNGTNIGNRSSMTYNNLIYSISGGQVVGFNPTIVNNAVNNYLNPISLPTLPVNGDWGTLFVYSGGYLISDARGRIYTSF